MIVSIHAPARGATAAEAAHFLSIVFQSTLPRGERHRIGAGLRDPDWVSIHAPARGATAPSRSARRTCWRFNPRSRAGSDDMWWCCGACVDGVSIHAPARGATR